MTTKTQRAKRNCDDRVRALIVARGYCERCGTGDGPFEHAHIIRRRYSWTRTDERNGWCLCKPCHQVVDTNAYAFTKLVEESIGRELFEELHEKSRRGDKFHWDIELLRLKALRVKP